MPFHVKSEWLKNHRIFTLWRFFREIATTFHSVIGSWQGSFTHIMRIFHSVREFLVAKCCFRSIVMYRDGKMVQCSKYKRYLPSIFKSLNFGQILGRSSFVIFLLILSLSIILHLPYFSHSNKPKFQFCPNLRGQNHYFCEF